MTKKVFFRVKITKIHKNAQKCTIKNAPFSGKMTKKFKTLILRSKKCEKVTKMVIFSQKVKKIGQKSPPQRYMDFDQKSLKSFKKLKK